MRCSFLLYSLLFISVIIIAPNNAWSQSKISKKSSSLKSKINELEQAITINEEDHILSVLYEEVGDEFRKIDDLDKSITYYEKSLAIHQKAENNSDVSRIHRKMAKVFEQKNKLDEAITNYNLSNQNVQEQDLMILNSNDIQRIQKVESPEIQNMYIDSNIQILEKRGDTLELIDALQQKGNHSLLQNDANSAVISFERALSKSKTDEESLSIKKSLAKAFKLDHRHKEAEQTLSNGMNNALKQSNYRKFIELSISLSESYMQREKMDSAIHVLKKSYDLALNQGMTYHGNELVNKMTEFYEASNHLDSAISIFRQFQADLESFLLSDSSLIDAKILDLTEQKIVQLENEKRLQDEMIEKKNLFNYYLLSLLFILLTISIFLVRIIRTVRKRNRKIALQSLRREMNPHFIFNSLNSVNQFIAQNNEIGANKYLSAYSSLMRTIMEYSNKDFIQLSEEISLVQKYIDLEHQRFEDVFSYEIIVDQSLEVNELFFPNMILQPHIENAVWHGLRYKETPGELKIIFKNEANKIKVIISDNGIGRAKSKSLKTENQQLKTSIGQKNVQERIALLNQLYKYSIELDVTDLSNHSGTEVIITVDKIKVL